MISSADETKDSTLPVEKMPDDLLKDFSEFLFCIKKASEIATRNSAISVLLKDLSDTGILAVKWDRAFLFNPVTEEPK